MKVFNFSIFILLSLMGAISLVKFNIANNNSETSLHLINSIINSDPPCCDPGSTAPSVSVSYSYDNGAGECCIVVTGSANTAFELIWPGQSSPWCQTSTNSFGVAECCYSLGTGSYKYVCVWQVSADRCKSEINPECN